MARRYVVTLLVEGDDLTTKDQVRALAEHRVDELGEVLRLPVLDVDVAAASPE